MKNTNFSSDALAELLKNAPTIKVDVKQTSVPSVEPTLPTTPVVHVNPPQLLPTKNLNISSPKKSNNILWIIGLSVVGGYVLYKFLRRVEDQKNNKNQ